MVSTQSSISKKLAALSFAAACLVLAGCSNEQSADTSAPDLTETVAELQEEVERLQHELDHAEEEETEASSTDIELIEPYSLGDGLYSSEAEAEEVARIVACEGTHQMGDEYMPCEQHGEFEENVNKIESAGNVAITKDGLYQTEDEALAAAAASGCTGTHQMGDDYMICDEHDEGASQAAALADEVAQAEETPDVVDDVDVETTDPIAVMQILRKSGRDILVEATYEGRPLENRYEVCIVHYNQYGNSTGCDTGFNFDYSPRTWKVECRRATSNTKPYFSILMLSPGSEELARIDVPEDSAYRCS